MSEAGSKGPGRGEAGTRGGRRGRDDSSSGPGNSSGGGSTTAGSWRSRGPGRGNGGPSPVTPAAALAARPGLGPPGGIPAGPVSGPWRRPPPAVAPNAATQATGSGSAPAPASTSAGPPQTPVAGGAGSGATNAQDSSKLVGILAKAKGKRVVVRLRSGDIARGTLTSYTTRPFSAVIDKPVYSESRSKTPPSTGPLSLSLQDVVELEIDVDPKTGRDGAPGRNKSSGSQDTRSPARSPLRDSRSPKLGPAAVTNASGGTSRKSDPTQSAQQQGSFRTDTDISKKNGSDIIAKGRELKRWKDADLGEDVGTLDDVSKGEWDQFAVNKQRFGVGSSYDEHFYTTAIDKNHPEYKERERRAERIAREIEKQGTGGNVHLAEERGLAVDDSGLDEEDKYSGVHREQSDRSEKVPAEPQHTDPAILYAKRASEEEKHGQAQAQAKNLSNLSPVPGQGTSFDQFVAAESKAAGSTPGYYNEREKYDRIHDFRQFSAEFKISSPVPPDLVPILGRRANTGSPAASPRIGAPASIPTSVPVPIPVPMAGPGYAPSSVPMPGVMAPPAGPPTAASPAAPKKKFNFSASAAKFGAFKPFTPGAAGPPPRSPGFQPGGTPLAGTASPAVAEVSKSTPKAKPGEVKGRFDFLANLEKKGIPVPRSFVTPPTWSTDSNVTYKEQFPPPMPVPVNMMPFGVIYPQQMIPPFMDRPPFR